MKTNLPMQFFIFAALFSFACNNNPEKQIENKELMDTTKVVAFSYDLNNPIEKYKMPHELEEISGIDFYKDEQTIACHNDEKGKIYLFDLIEEKIIDEFKFDKDGDYEDIAINGENAYVVRSDGKIFEIEDFTSKKAETKEYRTDLSAKNDIEGLCLDESKTKLLIACKSSPNINNSDHGDVRAIYSFEISEKKLNKNPYALIKLDEVKDTINTSAYEEFSKNIVKKLSSAGDPSFQPSAIAIHPITGEIYIVSSVGNKLVVLNKRKKITAIAPLDSKLFNQPEGICFKLNGNMLISNENKGGKANILEFNYLNNAD